MIQRFDAFVSGITAENGEKGLRMTISMPMLDRNLTKS